MSQTILLVEDNQTIYRSVLEHLGYRVLGAGDGKRGVAMAREAFRTPS
jgi:CheY-like chemotaxis protein